MVRTTMCCRLYPYNDANGGVGLGGLMHMVNKEYGLRETESFYWGPGEYRATISRCVISDL